MLPSEYKKMKRTQNKKPKVHQNISNTFIENAIAKNNLSALKTLYYLSTVLSTVDLQSMKDDRIVGIKIDKRDMLKFTGLSVDTIIKTTKRMQQTSITFIDYDEDGDKVIEGMNLLPRYNFVPNKNVVELDLYVKIAKMIVDVKKNYTPMNIKDLMQIKNKHSLRLLALLCKLDTYKDKDGKPLPKRKYMTLENLREFFGVNYKSWGEFERKIFRLVKEELDNNSKISFAYESNYERLGAGRPAFRNVTIDLIQKSKIQGKLLY